MGLLADYFKVKFYSYQDHQNFLLADLFLPSLF